MIHETIETLFGFAIKPETLSVIRRSAIADIIHENLSLDNERILNMIKGYLIEKNISNRYVCFEEDKFVVHLTGTSYYFRKK